MSKRRLSIFLASFALLFSYGCSSMPTVDPKIMDPLFTNASPGKYAAGAKFTKPKNWAVGQYVVTGHIKDGQKYAISKISIVGKEGKGFIFEIENINSEKKDVMQFLIDGIDDAMKKGKTDGIKIVWIKMKNDDGKVQTIEGPMLSMYKGMASSVTDNVQSTTTFTDGGAITVPAGVFAGTNKILTTTKTLGFSSKSTGYFHSAVPINGMVKSTSDDGEEETVLISFGWKGAKATLQ